MNRKTAFIVSLSLTIMFLLISLTMVILSLVNKFEITPNSNLSIRTYTDSKEYQIHNSEIINFAKSDNAFVLKYKVGSVRENPYVGFMFENHTWNFNKFDQVTITLDPEKCDPFALIFADFIPGFSDSTNDLTWRMYQHDIIPIKGKRKYVIPLEDFKTPNWWFGQYNQAFESQPKDMLSMVREIQFQNHDLGKPGEELTIDVSKLTFSKRPLNSMPFWIATILLGLISILFRQRKSVPIPYEKLDVEDKFTEEGRLVVEFIGTHYSRSDMSLSLVSIETGLQPKEIRLVLNTFFNKNFKQYLTDIRLEEAKRILLETDRLIADISLYVGYKHATTFTRLFRETFGVSPREYREKYKKKNKE